MTVGAAELKLSYDLFSKLLSWALGKHSRKKLEKLTSEAFQELLKGNAADTAKVAAAIKKLRKSGDCSASTERLEVLFDRIDKHMRTGEFRKPATTQALKAVAVKKVKGTAAKKVAARKPRFNKTIEKKLDQSG